MTVCVVETDRDYQKAVAPHLPISQEQLQAFLEKVTADTSLQEKLKAASDADAVVSIAKEEGFSISVDDCGIDDITSRLSNQYKTVLSDEDLEGVVGGTRKIPGR